MEPWLWSLALVVRPGFCSLGCGAWIVEPSVVDHLDQMKMTYKGC